jgi:glycosyltransferase involved in cell wall biosynthesis
MSEKNMTDNVLVSVVMPCYNHGKYIGKALQSVLSSTFQDFEIIIINDGSTDAETIELLNNMNIPRVEVISTKNQGLATARNIGISHSHGKYILPLDADDKISSGYLKDAVEILENSPNVKVVSCEIRYIGRKFGYYNLPVYSLGNLLNQNIMVASSFFRRSDFDTTIGYNPNMKYGYEDWDFWLSLLGNGGDVYRIPRVHFYYRIKRRSMVADLGKSNNRLDKMKFQIYENHKSLFAEHGIDPRVQVEYSAGVRLKALFLRKLKQYFTFIKL